MKNKNLLQILMPLVVALFILSLFSGIAAAQNPKESYDSTKEQYQQLKTRYDDAKKEYRDAKAKYLEAKDRVNTGTTNLSKEELINATKNYLIKSVDYIITHLNILKNRMDTEKEFIPFNAVAIIDSHITQMNDMKTKVDAATTLKELNDIAHQLDDTIINMNLEARYYVGLIIDNKIEQYMVKADNASVRMDSLIGKLEEQGKDVTKLKEYASAFNSLVSESKTNHQNEVILFETHSGFGSNGMVTGKDEARTFLDQVTASQKETIRKLRSAGEQFREFFKEAKKVIPGKIVVDRGTGKLEASGTGIARIRGNVTVALTVSGNASLIVSSNANVTVSGIGNKETLPNGDIKYKGSGSATVSGSAIRVEIYGDNITLTAEGTGSAVLAGKGTYSSDKGFTASGDWKKVG